MKPATAKTVTGAKPHFKTNSKTVLKPSFAAPLQTKTAPSSYFQMAQKIENLPQKKAFELVDELTAELGHNEFRLGAVLAVIHDKCKAEGNDEWLDGHKDFTELCQKRFKFKYRKAMYLIAIYKHLVDQKIPWDTVKDLCWSKLRVLASKKAIALKKEITKENAEQLVKMADKLTVEQLEDGLKGEGNTMGKEAPTVRFKHEDQQETYKEVLAKGKEEFGSEVPAVVYDTLGKMYICNALTGKEKPKQKGNLKEYWLDLIRALAKELKSDFDGSNDGAEIVGFFAKEYEKNNVKSPAQPVAAGQ
jgi:hypothetical protein